MKKLNSFVLLQVIAFSLVINSTVFAQQHNLQGILNQVKPPVSNEKIINPTQSVTDYIPHLTQLFEFEKALKSFHPKVVSGHSAKKAMSYPDTLIVGVKPYDTVTITGTLTHNGPIWVALNGLLIIKHANLTNLGDLVVFNNGRVIIDSSTVSFPQAYFYQRSLTIVNKGNVSISNTTLSYGGFSHNCGVYDTATLTITNVTQPDWMTTGMGNRGTININHTNQVGEIIIADYVNLNVKNATNCLLWHQMPDSTVLNWSFGKHDTAYGYVFNKNQLGIKGIEYNVHADSVYKIMWGMMPSSASNINITNSKIRSIGLWFDKPKDSVLVSGITDNATYSSFTTPLSDRTLTFSNCTVQTWSFYVFHKSIINVTGCIAGEIGTENASKMYGNNYVVDGSGGYHWTSDTSNIFASNATVESYVRSEKSGLFVFGYGTIGGSGLAEAIDNALLIVVQSTLPADPTAINGGCAWFDNINQPGNIFADSIAPINGSAWIHLGPTSKWMHFKHWQLFYESTDSTKWIPVTGIDTIPVSNALLANWNTHGLASGVYDLDLRITDTWGNSVDAIRQVTLLPLILGINELSDISNIVIYPNPANQSATISYTASKSEKVQTELTDILGRQHFINKYTETIPGKNTIRLNTSDLPNGTYVCRITVNGNSVQQLVVVSK
ncbi:MAG TPA: T9SS type A sorting domain-containing protein [Bacteroidia bacterium]|jgi:hypothetical protein|nr:T9SS type A sorting domain-containing protein [Bacteroidia bacterium]